MRIQASVIEELRSMFKSGATPSRLIQHIVTRHPHEGNWYALIQDYFREGFGVQIVRGLNPAETYGDVDLRYAYLNEDVLHEMVQARSMWDREPKKSGNGLPSWLDSLAATSALDRMQQAKQAGVPPDLSELWDRLSDRERSAIALANSGYQGRTEMVHILARVVECLQQRIVALERNRSELPTDRTIES
jgi:hypothetical protein